MQTGPETWRLRWQSWGATGREKWRLRRQLWIAMVRWWWCELRVRISLARYCAAIYRRELLAHRRETAGMEAEYWAKKGAKEPDW